MKFKVDLQKERMSEAAVRESIQKAARVAREHAERQGRGLSQDSVERAMRKNAEKDHKDGKI